jgi:hypothetical protein
MPTELPRRKVPDPQAQMDSKALALIVVLIVLMNLAGVVALLTSTPSLPPVTMIP